MNPMTAEPPDATREAFEAWAREQKYAVHRKPDGPKAGDYFWPVTQVAWLGWKARDEASRATLAERDSEIARVREALQAVDDWLTDPEKCGWPYMEGGGFHADKSAMEEKVSAALSVASGEAM